MTSKKKIEHIIDKGVSNGFTQKEILVAHIQDTFDFRRDLMIKLDNKVSKDTFWKIALILISCLAGIFTFILKLHGVW